MKLNIRKRYIQSSANRRFSENKSGRAVSLFLSNRLSSISWMLMIASTIFFGYGCVDSSATKEAVLENESEPVRVIFETDMGNDIDDALALDMLYKYADQGKIELLAVNSNKNNDYSVRYIDILNTWYGYPDIPIGQVIHGADSEGDSKNYAQSTWEHQVDGERVFRGSLSDYSKIPDAIKLYRQVLAQQPDSSVTIISVGFSTNLAGLLNTPADEYTDLAGKELVAKKVKLLSVMAGNFEENRIQEYNVVEDIKSAKTLFADWPTEIVVSPFEVGRAIMYPANSIENDFKWATHHPVVVAYRYYKPMPYDRPTWDLTSVLYAVEGEEGYFTMSKPGTISVDDRGYTNFDEDPAGLHRYLKVTPEQAAHVKERFIQLVSAKPKNLQP